MEKERIIEDLNSCWNIETFQEVTSTNDILKQRAPKGLADRTVLIAERQTKGKGRMGIQPQEQFFLKHLPLPEGHNRNLRGTNHKDFRKKI